MATGWFLGIGHLGLFVVAAILVMFRYSWAGSVLRWAYHSSIDFRTASWYSNSAVHDAAVVADKLPGGHSLLLKYGILAAACLAIRLFRFIPGAVALPVSLVAAFFGLAITVAAIPLLATYWPLAAVLLVVSLIIVGATRRR